MEWKVFATVIAGAAILALRAALQRVLVALVDVAAEKLVIAGLQWLARKTDNKLDDEIIEQVRTALAKDVPKEP